MSKKAFESAAPAAKWSTAVFAGLSLMGCPDGASSDTTETAEQKAQPAAVEAEKKDGKCCMGLNDCKGKGGCAVPESHACAGKNDCKGQGGCNMHCPK